jgi:hypothetical protein
MGIADLIRKRAEAERQLHPRWADAYPSLERNGLAGFTDPEDGKVRLETGHHLYLAASDSHPDWHLHITHDNDYGESGWDLPRRKVIADLGPGDQGVGDRVVRAIGHPEVMQGMRRLMVPAEPDESWNHNVRP